MEVKGVPNVCLVPNVLQIHSFVFCRRIKCIKVWNYMRDDDRVFIFLMEYPFKRLTTSLQIFRGAEIKIGS